MQKIIRRVINQKYTSIKPESIMEGSVINFDCYIKRFDDFVIIIESGTLISAELAHKIKQNDKLYILIHESDAYQSYQKSYALDEINVLRLDNVLQHVMGLEEKLMALSGDLEKLELVYQTTGLLMEAIFNEMTENLPVDALQKCAKHIVELIESSEHSIMPNVLRLIQNEYSTHYHSTNVAIFSTILGKATGMNKVDLLHLSFAALLHDIGKVRIDQSILIKPSTLDEDEYELIKSHSEVGYTILQNNGITNVKVLEGVLYHHEKLDGKGYPTGLHGKRIPKFARIIGMCDVFDALTTCRTYRINYTSYEALFLMKRQMAHQFDSDYSDTFIRLLAAS